MCSPDKILDSWLVLSYKTGNNKALALLVKRWHKKLCRQAFWYTKDMDSAKDIAQDSWQAIINNIHSLKNADQFGSWALTIVTRKAIDYNKKHNKLNRNFQVEGIAENTRDPNQISLEDDKLLKIRKGLRQLQDDKRQILTLFYLEGYSLKEISAILKMPIATVKTRLFRAREKLKSIIKNANYEK
ncbi:RNA polymerase sigma factor [Spongiivirga citrea]|uniref:Sigma-70 family RNA polymerase sigma factor n=1 Tax=Spongiivirga citrea TaxID=1481457 RepID=A0A6M0CQW4_9FLAO|nr:RNA polymerase sigma factor [Spongiivirga citrea]NER16320.1 sigma-70 family RNA polymerase sigma factor [Spongiivirga citrea]